MISTRNKHGTKGFTLVEVLIASSISLVATGMILTTYLQSMQGLHDSHHRMELAYQINQFTNEMAIKASRSNYFTLYISSQPADIDAIEDRQRLFEDNAGVFRPAGDCAVFVYYDFPKAQALVAHQIRRIEIYSLTDLDAQRIGTVQNITIDLSAVPSGSSIESILTNPAYYANGSWNAGVFGNVRVTVSEPFPLVRGLALAEHINQLPVTDPPPRLFYMTASRNITIMGQHYSGNGNINSNNRRTHTNAFTFNITPRT